MPKAESTNAIKILITFSDQGVESIDGQSRVCNWLYNHLLQRAGEVREGMAQLFLQPYHLLSRHSSNFCG